MTAKKIKTYTVSLDQDDTELAQEKLEKAGMTLSGFIRMSLRQFLENLEVGQEKKSFKDMSAAELLEAIERMKEKLNDE